jgi:hypothetical protein
VSILSRGLLSMARGEREVVLRTLLRAGEQLAELTQSVRRIVQGGQ